LIDSSNEL